MSGLGYRFGTIDELIRLRDHGVDPEYVRGMAANGLPKLSADDLVRARDHGVDPEYVRGLAALGYRNLGLDDLVNARDHGVDPEYVRGMQALGHTLALDGFTRTRDHGVIRNTSADSRRSATMNTSDARARSWRRPGVHARRWRISATRACRSTR